MGVYVKDIKMPDCCVLCPFFAGNGCNITRQIFPDWLNVASRPDSCPIVEVKVPHGRLKDVDKILQGEGRYVISFGKDGIDTEEINRAPTIIEAED